MLAPEFGVAHALGVVLKVSGLDSDGVGNPRCGGIDGAKEPD